MTLSDLAQYVPRHPTYLRQTFLKPLVEEGLLKYLYPDLSSHPRQAYVTVNPSARVPKAPKQPQPAKLPF
jgi:hypothetical protein